MEGDRNPANEPFLDAFGRGPDARSTNIPSGGGVPPWLAATLNYCSRCGTELTIGEIEGEDRQRLGCPSCGHIAYVNPRLVVTTIPVTDDGRIVLLRRGIEPGRGLWAQPGGFLEVDETVTEAAVRETLEETGLIVEPGEIVGLYSRLEAAVVVLAFEARVLRGEYRLNPEALEIEAFRPDAIPWKGIAFKTTYWAIRDWLNRRRPDIHPADRHWDE
jgi:ADP-ribose pyrophosphatase YjhB (NUDIX family)